MIAYSAPVRCIANRRLQLGVLKHLAGTNNSLPTIIWTKGALTRMISTDDVNIDNA